MQNNVNTDLLANTADKVKIKQQKKQKKKWQIGFYNNYNI